mgnify:FL=1
MVLWIPDWPVNCLVVDLPPGGVGAVVHAKRIEVASASARRCGVRAGMSVREATYLCPELICLPRDPDREARAFNDVIDAFDTVAAGVECLRPGLARCRARGPARWAGGEEQAASLLVDAIEEAVGVECFVGIADGPLASVEAARAGRIVPAEDTRFFLSGIGLSRALGCVPPSMRDRTSATVDLLASLGITSCADLLQLGRGPVLERFGDVGERLWILASGGDAAVLSSERAQADITVEYDIDGGGESVQTMTVPVIRAAEELAGRLYGAALVSHTLRIDVEDGGGGSRSRTWSGCDLSVPADIALRVRWTLTGWMACDQGPSGEARSIRLTACDPCPGSGPSALWGRSNRKSDVSRSAVRIQGLAGPDALLVPRVQGGYDPRSRIVMAPWGNQEPLRSRVGAWEGAVAEPPSTLFDTPIPVLLVAEPGAGGDVRVDQRGSLTATPAYLLTKNGGEGLPGRLLPSGESWECSQYSPQLRAGQRCRIRAIAGPWPVGGCWWSGERARAYMRATLEDGQVALLVWSGGEWMAEGLDN